MVCDETANKIWKGKKHEIYIVVAVPEKKTSSSNQLYRLLIHWKKDVRR